MPLGQPSGGGRGGRKILNYKQCFDLWRELGSLKKVSLALYREGIFNKVTGQPLTHPAIRRAAYVYILENPEEAYEVFQSLNSIYSETREGWEDHLIHMAHQALKTSRKRVLTFYVKNGFVERAYKYGYIRDDERQYILDHPETF